MSELRLGDVIDDFCVKCRRLTNHSIVSIMNSAAAKVRCRTCYSDHDYRNEQAPPSKKELARQKELYNAVLAGTAMPLDAAPQLQSPPVMEAAAADAVSIAAAEIVEPPVDGAARPAAEKSAKGARKK